MRSAGLHLDHVAPVIDKFASSLHLSVAGEGSTGRRIPAQPETLTRLDDECRSVDIAAGRRVETSRGDR